WESGWPRRRRRPKAPATNRNDLYSGRLARAAHVPGRNGLLVPPLVVTPYSRRHDRNWRRPIGHKQYPRSEWPLRVGDFSNVNYRYWAGSAISLKGRSRPVVDGHERRLPGSRISSSASPPLRALPSAVSSSARISAPYRISRAPLATCPAAPTWTTDEMKSYEVSPLGLRRQRQPPVPRLHTLGLP